MGRELKKQIDETAAAQAKEAEKAGEVKTAAAAREAAARDADAAAIDAAVNHPDAATIATKTDADAVPEPAWKPPTVVVDDVAPPLFSPEKPPSHEEYVKQAIEEDRIPSGVRTMADRRYILRPEAIESVFYMHRLTGSPYWRTAGWKMVSAMLKHTRTPLAHAAIDDVTKANPQAVDSMESFWLAETLKYAYLLFEEEEAWSLDEWILNTEAHLLKRVT